MFGNDAEFYHAVMLSGNCIGTNSLKSYVIQANAPQLQVSALRLLCCFLLSH